MPTSAGYGRTSERRVASTGASMQRVLRAMLAMLLALPAGAVVAQTATPPAAKAPAAAKSVASPSAGDSGLKSRVESLEEQLVDMQVVIGTLESLAKQPPRQGGASFAASPASGGESVRIDSLESQIRLLTSQVQQLSDQIRQMGGTPQRRSDAAPAPGGEGFGATTVVEGGDPIGGLLGNELPPATTFGGQAPPPQSSGAATPAGGDAGFATSALPPANDGADPKQLYETAYGYLLQRDYGAAEVALGDFLKRFPNDSLSGSAQYWLGEAHFVRGQYKAAAASFLKGYQTYAQSPKAADSLLKLAMSLDRLGQKDAACSSFAELGSKFPNAAQTVKSRAQSERQRVGCS